METYRKSNSQGKLHSHSHHRISNLSSIVERLVSWSLTGRGLDITVHQHYGFRLHLLWKCNGKSCKRLESCFERHFFNYTDLKTFCSELTTGGLEGLCDCVSEDVCKFVKVKACNRNPKTQSQKNLNATFYNIKVVSAFFKRKRDTVSRGSLLLESLKRSHG
jgi:hypothetical protein